MNQRIHLPTLRPSCPPIVYTYIILFYLLTRIAFCSVNPKFQACEPKTCGGTNDQNISFPFYIMGKQQSFCGYADFGLTCGENGFPIVNTSSTLYMIHKIFYTNQSLRVSIPEFSEPSNSGCIAPVNNFSHRSRRFSIASNQKEVMLFYGCDLLSLPEEMEEHRIGCSAENRTRSVVAFYGDDPNSKLTTAGNCTGPVVSTTVEDEKGGIEEGLRRGFVLNWMAKNCSECSSSGGRCGYDHEADAFRCYCRDRVDDSEKNCDPRPGLPISPLCLEPFLLFLSMVNRQE